MRRLGQRVAKNGLAGLALAAVAGVLVADCAPLLPWGWAVAALGAGLLTLWRPRVRWLNIVT